MGLCLSCHRGKGPGPGKKRGDVNLCQSLGPLHECISECSSLSLEKASTLPGQQRSEDTFYRTSILTPSFQPSILHSQNESLPTFTDSIQNSNKLYICKSNGKHSIVIPNGHIDSMSSKDICINKCDNLQLDLDLIHVKTCTRDSMTMANMGQNIIKTFVSKNMKRFVDEDYDLDLTYITKNIIGMGLPAEKFEKIYRNNIDDVARFLEERHKNHYKIYNLCSEKSYDCNKFQNRVAVYPFDDHNPPTIEQIRLFCIDVNKWLMAHSDNVVAIHCKAGKGRTGTMISCYLLHNGDFQTATDALNYYGRRRTQDSKGVTIPSQRRYVEYYAAFLMMFKEFGNAIPVKCIQAYRPPSLSILKLLMVPPPILNGGQTTLELFVTRVNGSRMSIGTYEVKKGVANICIQPDRCAPLVGDIKVEVYNTKHKIKMRKEKLFHFWFNTFFVIHQINAVQADGVGHSNPLFVMRFTKWELDEAHKDKNNKSFTSDFSVELTLQSVPETSNNWSNMDQQQRARLSPGSRSHSSSAEEDSEDSSGPEANWDSGGVVGGDTDILRAYRKLSEPELDVDGGPSLASPGTCPCPDMDAMLQA